MSRPAPDDPGFAAWLDQIRRSLDLGLDAHGRWWHEGEPFVNQRLIDYFDQNLDVHPDSGEPILRVGDTWCYIQVADTAFFIRRVRVAGGALWVHLNTGAQLPMPASGVELVGEHAYLDLGPHRRAKFTRDAWNQLAGWIEEGLEGPEVQVGEARWPIRG